jgi:galactose mutarotase-like enzyme
VIERDSVELRAGSLALSCVPRHGNVVTSLAVGGVELLWQRPGFAPAQIQRGIGPGGAASIDTFMDIFVGGWFQMFPSVGLPGTKGSPFDLLHGEVARLPWEKVAQGPSELVTRVSTLRTPFEVERRLEVDGRAVRCSTKIRNVGREEAPYLWGEHPCFDRDVFAGGAIAIDDASLATASPPYDPPNSRLQAGAPGRWPYARAAADEGPFDVGAIPETTDGRQEHICLRPERGSAQLTSPKLGRTITLDFDLAAYPFVLVWQNYRAPGGSCWGAIDTFTVEPSNNPALYSDDAFSAGSIQSLAAGEERETLFTITVSDRAVGAGHV